MACPACSNLGQSIAKMFISPSSREGMEEQALISSLVTSDRTGGKGLKLRQQWSRHQAC